MRKVVQGIKSQQSSRYNHRTSRKLLHELAPARRQDETIPGGTPSRWKGETLAQHYQTSCASHCCNRGSLRTTATPCRCLQCSFAATSAASSSSRSLLNTGTRLHERSQTRVFTELQPTNERANKQDHRTQLLEKVS